MSPVVRVLLVLIALQIVLIGPRLAAAGAPEHEQQAPTSGLDQEDQDKLTPLMRAAARSDLKDVNALLAKGANPNVRSSEQNITALMFAAYFGHVDVIKALVARGAQIELKDAAGAAAADWAAVGGHADLEPMLTGKGVSLNPFLNIGALPLAFMDRAKGK
jgi:ankyrin repeat protein